MNENLFNIKIIVLNFTI